ncbi:hypothetical protein MKX01_037999, partial [Papaver californicum]
VKTIIGNEVEVGGLHEDEGTEMRSCVQVNGSNVCASEKPIKQVFDITGALVAMDMLSMLISQIFVWVSFHWLGSKAIDGENAILSYRIKPVSATHSPLKAK